MNAIILIPIVLLFLSIFVVICVYVYRDASRRGMNAPVWMLIAALAPSFVGLIIYLLVRSKYSDLKCSVCNATVREDYLLCPVCGAKLHAVCSNCGSPLESGWTVCPHCATPCGETSGDIIPPVRHKDRALGKILLIIVAALILSIGFLIVSYNTLTFSELRIENVSRIPIPYSVTIYRIDDNVVTGTYTTDSLDEIHALINYMENAVFVGTDNPVYENCELQTGYQIVFDYDSDDAVCVVFFRDRGCYIVAPDWPDSGRYIRFTDMEFYRGLQAQFE